MRLILSFLLIVILAFAPNDARKANEAYERGDYERAAELYRQALQSDPDNARLHFNLGNSLAKMGQAQEAVNAYQQFRSLTDNPREQALADYNIGNLLAEAEQLEEAAEFYRNALRNNPDDDDARHNYELALRQQLEQEQQQPQQDQDQNQDQDQDEDQDQDQQQQPQQDPQQDPDQDQNQQPDEGDSPEDQQERESEISLEEAENILDALEQRERELLRDREKEATEETSDDEKDW